MINNYSKLRKELQRCGEAPIWYTTGGLQLFYEKYSWNNETPKNRWKTIAKAMAQHAPTIYPDYWEEDEYTKGKTWEEVFFNSMWDGFISPSTPLLANGGLRKRGTTVSCLTAESPILVKDCGMKQIKDIVAGDEVLTHKGRWRKVTNTQNRMSDKDLYLLTVDTRTTPLKITGNHPVLTNEGWVKVEDLDVNRHFIATNSKIESVGEDAYIDLNSVQSNLTIRDSVATSVNKFVKIDKDLAWALGLWFAEGSLNICDTQYGRTIRITMSQNEKHYLSLFGETIKEKFGVNYKVADSEFSGRKWSTCTVNSIYLANYFGEVFGTSCLTKTMPRSFIDMPVENVEAFLKGVYEGGGRKSAGSKLHTPDIRLSNSPLVAQLYEMSLKLGLKVSLQLQKKDGRNNRSPYASLTFFDGGLEKRELTRNIARGILFGDNRYCKFKLQEVDQDEVVYDITVDEDESFSVGGVVVHNCAGGNVGDNLYDRYNAITEAAILTKHSHGTSYNISDWPCEGYPLKRGGYSLGVMPLIRDMIACMNEVTQASRRGSLAYSLDIEHGDFDKVLEHLFKHPESNNVGWLIKDSFIKDLQANKREAVTKFDKTLGVKMPKGKGYYTFIDKMNRNRAEAFKRAGLFTKASNLCQETNLPSSEEYTFSCVILCYNLELYRSWPKHLVQIGQVMSDCNISEYLATMDEMTWLDRQAMSKIYKFTKDFRALGSGVLAWHTLLQQESIVVGSMESMYLNNEVFKHLDEESLKASIWLAKVSGEPDGCKGLGIRNATRLMMPPTKSTADIMGGGSEGIGYEVAMAYTKQSAGGEFFRINKVLLKIMKERGVYNDEEVLKIAKAKSVQKVDWLNEHEKKVFRTAFEIPVEWIIRLASQRQKYIDQAQSINLYFTSNDSEEYIGEMHKMAFEDEGILSLYYIYSMRGADGVIRDLEDCPSCSG